MSDDERSIFHPSLFQSLAGAMDIQSALLRSTSPTTSLIPNLRRLSWEYQSTSDIVGCRIILQMTRGLQAFSFEAPLSRNGEARPDFFIILEALHHFHPSLKALELDTSKCGLLTEAGASRLWQAIRDLPSITELRLPVSTFTSPPILTQLHTLSSLTNVVMLDSSWDKRSFPTLHGPISPPLRWLHGPTNVVAHIMSLGHQYSQLTSVHCEGGDGGNGPWGFFKTLLEDIVRSCPAVEDISVSGTTCDPPKGILPISGTICDPLLGCPQLTSIYIDIATSWDDDDLDDWLLPKPEPVSVPRAFNLTDHDWHVFSASCPDLRSLRYSCGQSDHPFHPKPLATLQSLVSIVQNCPKLHTLAIPIQARRLSQGLSSSQVFPEGSRSYLRSIDLLQAWVDDEDAQDAAECLKTLASRGAEVYTPGRRRKNPFADFFMAPKIEPVQGPKTEEDQKVWAAYEKSVAESHRAREEQKSPETRAEEKRVEVWRTVHRLMDRM